MQRLYKKILFFSAFCIFASGCAVTYHNGEFTFHKQNGETITWPAPATGNQVASSPPPYYQSREPSPQADSTSSQLTIPTVPGTPSSSSQNPSDTTALPDLTGTPVQSDNSSPAPIVESQASSPPNQSSQSPNPPPQGIEELEQSLTPAGQMKRTLDALVQAYKQWPQNKAYESMGFNQPPNNSDYIIISRNDLPIISQPDFHTDHLRFLALTDFLIAGQWQDFKETVAEAIAMMEDLIEVAKNNKDSESEPNGAPISENGISREEALKIFGLKDGCSQADIKKAYRKAAKKWHPDYKQNTNFESVGTMNDTMREGKMKEINGAKDVLLGKD